MHIRNLLDNGRKRVNQLHTVISNRNINLSARRHLLLSNQNMEVKCGMIIRVKGRFFGIHNIRWSQADPWVFF